MCIRDSNQDYSDDYDKAKKYADWAEKEYDDYRVSQDFSDETDRERGDEKEMLRHLDLDEDVMGGAFYAVDYMDDGDREGEYTQGVFDEEQLNSLNNSGYEILDKQSFSSREAAERYISMEDDFGDDEDDFGDDEDDLDETLYENSWSDPMTVSEGVEVSEDLKYHLDNKIALGESLFRYGSDSYVKLYTEVKKLNDLNVITLNENDEELIKDFTSQSIMIEGERVLLNLIVEDNGEHILEEGKKKSKDKYKGKKSNSPTRGASGGKAYKVFVPGCNTKTESNPRGIKKIQFGSGGLKAKLSDKEAKKSYNARHGCAKGKHNDKCKAGYWSCRLPRYAKSLGLSGGGTWW